jgi:hypothetical protein
MLNNVRSCCSDGETELLNSMVEHEAPESKLQTSVLLGGGVTLAAVLLSSFMGQDPWGGLGWNEGTASGAAIGVMAAMPLAALRLWSWSPSATAALPALKVHGAGAKGSVLHTRTCHVRCSTCDEKRAACHPGPVIAQQSTPDRPVTRQPLAPTPPFTPRTCTTASWSCTRPGWPP